MFDKPTFLLPYKIKNGAKPKGQKNTALCSLAKRGV